MFLPAALYDVISAAIPQVLDLLKDSDSSAQSNGASTIARLAEHRM